MVIPLHFWLAGWARESLQFKTVRDWPWRSGEGVQALLHLLSHLLVSSCVPVSVARLTAPLGKHSLGAPAAEPLLAHHLVCAPVSIFSLSITCQGPTAWLSPAASQEPLQVRAEA